MYTLTTVEEILTDEAVIQGLLNSFGSYFSTNCVKYEMTKEICDYFGKFEKDVQIVVEDYYVDKVYRNIYSHFFTTKLRDYGMYCVRLLLFTPDIDISKAYEDPNFQDKLKSEYLGFVVIRPISPGTVGRSVISPRALIIPKTIQISSVNVRSSVLGYKIQASGFPHSSQDEQYLTCAETTIWSIMEYYGNKYVEYSPILPSGIHQILSALQYERDVPSTGLDYALISNVLKEQGFGCLIYSSAQESQRDRLDMNFYRIFSCYVESGIPFVVALNDFESTDFGHAVVCVGEEVVDREIVQSITPTTIISEDLHLTLHVYRHWNEHPRRFVFNDDNVAPYALVDFYNPCPQHTDVSPIISNIIIPLHKKIYMDASRAMELAEIVASNILDVNDGLILRTILVSTNSYMNFIAKSQQLSEDLKEFLIGGMRFPKFLWITEIADKEDFINKKCGGLILLDATEPLDSRAETSILFGINDNFMIYYNIRLQEFESNSLTLSFKIESYCNLQNF